MIDTRGRTDIVMKLFDPYSETALIPEDDDSRYASTARIAANLIAGESFPQIRHYNRESGPGVFDQGQQEVRDSKPPTPRLASDRDLAVYRLSANDHVPMKTTKRTPSILSGE